MAVTAKNSRNLGIDLMRAMAMFFIICLHIMGQGGLIANAVPGSGKYYFLTVLQILTYGALDAYGITTGYLMCTRPFRLSRVTKLWVITVFWSVVVSCIVFVFLPVTRSAAEAISMFLPILRGRYWFFIAYFVTMLVSPVLNVVIRTLTRTQFKLLMAALALIFGVFPVGALGNDVMRISGGSHFSWMMVLYLIGGYIRRFGREDRSERYVLGYFLCSLVQLVYVAAVRTVGLGGFSGLLTTHVSPLVVGAAVCMFLYCRSVGEKIRAEGIAGRVIRFVTPGIYAVYVIHVHPKVFWRESIINLFRPWDNWNVIWVFLALVGTAAAVFAVCVLLDAARQWLFRAAGVDRAVDRLSDAAEQKIRKLLSEDK